MKKAFTMLELIFVIVIVGILSFVAASSFQGNTLREAADQLVSHIRYTQHLAMMDDKFDPNDNDWYKERWQIRFSNTGGSDYQWSYTIYAESAIGGPDGVPNKSEMAINPLDSTKLLTGGYSVGTVAYNDAAASKKLNLGHSYGVQDIYIDPTSGCYVNAGTGNRSISFDMLGRPLYNHANALTAMYYENANIRLVQTQCRIQICLTNPCTTATNENKITIAIEPETGYTHIRSNP